MKKLLIGVLLVCSLLLVLAGCGNDSQWPSNLKVKELTVVVDETSIIKLNDYTKLEKVDLSGSTCYDRIMAYAKSHPDIDVTYTVEMGAGSISVKDETAVLTGGSYEFNKLVQNLQYLPNLKTLKLEDCAFNVVQLDALRYANPNLSIICVVNINGVELNADSPELDLSAITSEQVDAVAAKLQYMIGLERVNVLNAEGECTLSVEDLLKLQLAAPGVAFNYEYEFELFGQTISSTAERVEFVDVQIGDSGEQQIRDALNKLINCKYFKLDNCGLSNEVMAQIRNDYPHIKIVWRVFQTNKNRSWLTDTETVRSVYGVSDSNSDFLKYFTDVKYLDLGSNDSLTDISFVKYMPNLEIAILSGSAVKDLSPLANCKKLEFLELASCGQLTDVSPLAQCTGLKYLNIGHTKVANVASLTGLKLEMLSFVNSGNKVGMTEADWKAIQTAMPNCMITYSPLKDSNATAFGVGWRYKKTPLTASNYTDIYKKVREVFDYDSVEQSASNNQPATPTGDAAVTKITKVVTETTISELLRYKNLETANLSGSTCYAAIMEYMKAHPKVKVTYTVFLGGTTTVKNSVTELSVDHGNYDLATLMENLKYLPNLKNITFPNTSLSAEQIAALKEAYPNLTVKYTMATQGTEINATVTGVDLSAVTSSQLDSVIAQLNANRNVVWVELMKTTGGSNLSIADVKKLQTACPNVIFHYSFTLFGQTVSTTDNRIEYVDKEIGNEGEDKIREALDILTACTYFKLDNCKLTNEVLAGIRDDYQNLKLVWRIWQPNKDWRSWLTDTDTLRAVYGINDENSEQFKYLTEVKYMDLGHNTSMVDLSFIAYMPNLEIAILSGSPIKDLTPLANCKKLEFLELAWCGHLKDVSPLAGCDSLKYLNVGHTSVKDFTSLSGLDLQLLSFVNSGNKVGLTAEYWAEVQKMFPNCLITYNPLKDNSATPYGVGWRYKANGGYTPIYRKCRDVFGYDNM